MLGRILREIDSQNNNIDSVVLINKEGFIEYASIRDREGNLLDAGYSGKHILEVYPGLTEEGSTMLTVLKTGEPIIDAINTRTDFNGLTLTFETKTYPVFYKNQIIGALENTIYLNKEELDYSKFTRKRSEEANNKDNEKEKDKELHSLDDFITVDKEMLREKERVYKIAGTDVPVMVVGETGTGKEIIAEAVHFHSDRNKGPFISQNCSAIPTGLLESTLFGTRKGSYTGAENKKGLFELADEGTLFLDELNSMDVGLQGKILKAVEAKKIRRLGDEKECLVNVRIITAMNCNPQDAIEEGKLRNDLYYRLGVVQIDLSPLKDRKCDIPILIDYFIKNNNKSGKQISGYSELAKKMLMDYNWPGNVRELRNAVEYGMNFAKGPEIKVSELPKNLVSYMNTNITYDSSDSAASDVNQEGRTLTEIMDSIEKGLILKVYKDGVSKTDAAKKLGLSRQVLLYKLKKYGIE